MASSTPNLLRRLGTSPNVAELVIVRRETHVFVARSSKRETGPCAHASQQVWCANMRETWVVPCRFLSHHSLRKRPILPLMRASGADGFEEVVAFVVDQDESREILDVDFPDSFHAQFLILDDFHVTNVFLG